MDGQSGENKRTANEINLLLLVSSIETNEARTKRLKIGSVTIILPADCGLLTSRQGSGSGRGSDL